MEIQEGMEVANLKVGEIIKKYDTNSNSDMPNSIIFKTAENKALTMGLNEIKTLVEVGVYNTQLEDNEIKCYMTKKQLNETIKNLKRLHNQLREENY